MIYKIALFISISLLFINCSTHRKIAKRHNKSIVKRTSSKIYNNRLQEKQNEFVGKYIQQNRDFVKKIEHKNSDFIYKYEKQILYENNYEASQLLDIAKFYPNNYDYVKRAFDKHSEMQYGIFAILDNKEKQKYIREHKKYIYALFKATKTTQQVRDTFNRWLNYKRTLFDNENRLNSFNSNNLIRAKIAILNRKNRELARATPKEQESLREDISNFERSLSSDMYESSQKLNIDYRDIATLLNRNELYIDFAKIADFYYIFILDRKENIRFKKIKSQEIDLTIEKIRGEIEKLNNPEKYPYAFPDIPLAKKQYGKLYDLIIRPLNIENKQSLIISPDGLLNLIPFEAFYHQQYLIEKLSISYIPSGKELVKLHNNRNSSNSQIVVFANPNFETNQKGSKNRRGEINEILTPTFINLKGSKKEAEKIKAIFPKAKLLLENQANEINLLKTNSPKILHLSTHGFFLKNQNILNPMLKSGIVLSGANESIRTHKSDGIIKALELSGINLKGTELVVLSACETGLGEIEEAQGIVGLNKAFMKAGAKQIVMSLWSVDDMATALLMEHFYQNIKSAKSYSDALRNSKIWMIGHNMSHPFYWSGFVGSGRD